MDDLTVVSAGNARWFSATLKLVGAYEDLDLGLFRFSRGGCWMPVVVARRGEWNQRVQIQNLRCESCAWAGLAGNPCYWELYIDAPGKDEALDRVFSLPLFECPDCGVPFDVRVFWVSPRPEAE